MKADELWDIGTLLIIIEQMEIEWKHKRSEDQVLDRFTV